MCVSISYAGRTWTKFTTSESSRTLRFSKEKPDIQNAMVPSRKFKI